MCGDRSDVTSEVTGLISERVSVPERLAMELYGMK